MSAIVLSTGAPSATFKYYDSLPLALQYYNRILELIRTRQGSDVIRIKVDLSQDAEAWRPLREAIDCLLYDQKQILSFGLAPDGVTHLIQVTAQDTCDLTPNGGWFSIVRPSVRVTQVPQVSPGLSLAQMQCLDYMQCMTPMRNSRVLLIDAAKASAASVSPPQDLKTTLTYMLETEKSIYGYACGKNNTFLVWVAKEDLLEGTVEEQRLSGWVVLDPNPEIEAASNLTGLLDRYSERLSDRQEYLNPSPQLKSLGTEILSLLPQVAVLPSSSAMKYPLVLMHIMEHVDWLPYLGRIHPSVIRELLLASLDLGFYDKRCLFVLTKLSEGLLGLPAHHPNIRALVEAFPICPIKLEPLIAAHNHNWRQHILTSVEKAKDRRGIEKLTGNIDHLERICAQYLSSEAFKKFFRHMPERLRAPFLRILCSYSVGCDVFESWKFLPGQLGDYEPSHRTIILEGLSRISDPKFAARVCCHEAADASIVSRVLKFNPPDRWELCSDDNYKRAFAREPDPFFSDFVRHVNTEKGWLLLLELLLQDDQRLKKFFESTLSNPDSQPFLAHNFFQLPEVWQKQLYSSKLLDFAEIVLQQPRDTQQRNLNALMQVLNARDLSNYEMREKLRTVLALAPISPEAFQAQVIQYVLQNSDSAALQDVLPKLVNTLSAAWETAGKTWSVFRDSFDLVGELKKLNPAHLEALCRGLKTQSDDKAIQLAEALHPAA